MSPRTDKRIPKPYQEESPIEYALRMSTWYQERKEKRLQGQVFTPPLLAQYMASSFPATLKLKRILDPGTGTGILSCAIVERLVNFKNKQEFEIHAVDLDSEVTTIANKVLEHACDWAEKRGSRIKCNVIHSDFIEFGLSKIGLAASKHEVGYDLIIMNPPYFKVGKKNPAVEKSEEQVGRNLNMYTVFMSVAIELLRKGGYLVSVNPRSFLSGKYFEEFRTKFFNLIKPYRIHRFKSREHVFTEASVLQETVILSGVKNGLLSAEEVEILSSNGTFDIKSRESIKARLDVVLSSDKDRRFALPVNKDDLKILNLFRKWNGTLEHFGIKISTGPVVPFRSHNLVIDKPKSFGTHFPLLWMQHIHPLRIKWPLDTTKPQYIEMKRKKNSLVKNGRYIILRRFISKDSQSRLIAAIIPRSLMKFKYIGIENHLNVIHQNWESLNANLALGLCVFLNSEVVSRFFHILNGTTQVNSYDMRLLPLPKKEQVVELGESAKEKRFLPLDIVDQLVEQHIINHITE